MAAMCRVPWLLMLRDEEQTMVNHFHARKTLFNLEPDGFVGRRTSCEPQKDFEVILLQQIAPKANMTCGFSWPLILPCS